MKRKKLGDIFEIPLPDGRNVYARLFRESTLGFYKGRYENFMDVPEEAECECIVCVYTDLLKDGEWPIVGNRPFDTEDDSWPPPKCIKDAISGEYRLYYKGVTTPSTFEECHSLERVAAWDRHHIVDRLMGNTKWN